MQAAQVCIRVPGVSLDMRPPSCWVSLLPPFLVSSGLLFYTEEPVESDCLLPGAPFYTPTGLH